MNCYIGIDLGGTIVKIGLVKSGQVIASLRIEADSQAGLGKMLPEMGSAIHKLLTASLPSGDNLCGISLAFPGIVDFPSKKAMATNAKYNDAPSIDMNLWARDAFGVPFSMDNDARAAMIGEWKYGAGKGVDNLVMMTIGTGIGTGVVVDSRPLYGRNWCAGSLGGHMVVDYHGRKCTCGNIGCVEAHSSSFFLPKIIGENMNLSSEFRKDSSNFNFKNLFNAYRNGEPDAKMVVTECMDVWSAAVVNYIHAYDPEVVVIGGGIMKSADIILPYIKEHVDTLAWCPGEKKVSIVASKLGDDAALLASDYYFDRNE